MSVAFLCREGPVARYIAHALHARGRLDVIVVERGRGARRRKLEREWARTAWWRAPLFALDLVALAAYGRLWARHVATEMKLDPALAGFPVGIPVHVVEDANDAGCLRVLTEAEPDVLVVLGTSILGPPILDVPKEVALNIHGGIVPRYRNVHSEVWAVLDDDLDNVGTSILHLGEGIDRGAIALQGRVKGARTFLALRWLNVELSARLICDALDRHEAGTLPREAQDSTQAGFYRTPGFRDLLRLSRTRLTPRADDSVA